MTSFPLYSEEYHFNEAKEEFTHSHEFLEIGILLSESLVHHTQNESIQLFEGSVYFVPIGAVHSLSVTPGLSVRNLYLLPRILCRIPDQTYACALLQDFLLYLAGGLDGKVCHIRLSESHLSLIRFLTDAYDQAALSAPLQESFRFQILSGILHTVCDGFCLGFPDKLQRKDPRVYLILDLIRNQLALPAGELIELLSNTLSLHPQTLNRLIKKELYTTLSDVIYNTKIEKSCELLLNRYTITETAAMLGFYDHSHFYKLFRRKLGLSPAAYQVKNNLLLRS